MKKLLPIVILLSLVTGLSAYVASFHWAVLPVNYVINPTNSEGLNTSQVITEIRAAADAWAAQSGSGAVASYQGSSSATCASVYDQVNLVCFRSDPTNGYIAQTLRWTYDGQTALLDSDLIINTIYPFYTDNTACNGGYSIKNTTTHEWGHMFGLDHSTDAGAVMFPTEGTCETSKEVLAADDIAGILSIYPTTGPPAPAPPTLSSVSPSVGTQGTTVPVTLTGTHFIVNGTTVNISGSGVTASSISASSTTNLTANFVVGSTATTGARTVSVTTSSGTSGSQSFTVNATAPPSVPSTPTSPSPANMGTVKKTANVTLSWSAPGATRYVVTLNGVAHSVNSASFKAGKLKVGTYTWSVVATNSAGSTPGPTWTFTSVN